MPRCRKTQDGEWKAAGTVHEPVGAGSCRGNPGVSVLAEGGATKRSGDQWPLMALLLYQSEPLSSAKLSFKKDLVFLLCL